jgi:hypothetical protein
MQEHNSQRSSRRSDYHDLTMIDAHGTVAWSKVTAIESGKSQIYKNGNGCRYQYLPIHNVKPSFVSVACCMLNRSDGPL